MHIYQEEHFSEVYKKLLKDLLNKGDYTSPNNSATLELENVQFQIENTKSCLFKNKIRSSKKKYIERELRWYISGDTSIDYISQHTKLWENICDDNNQVYSNYGHILFNQQNNHKISEWFWAVSQLSKDKETRKSIIRFSKPRHSDPRTKDFVCAMYGYFSIRNNKLNFSVSMRSNDVILGLPNDIAFFSILHQNMFNIIKEHHRDIELGTYTHKIDSLHVYRENISEVEAMLNQPFKNDILDLSIHKLVDQYGLRVENYGINISKMLKTYYKN